MKTFEEYLMDVAPREVHTNNDPTGFERWLEQLDTQEVMDWAERYGKVIREELKKNIIEKINNAKSGEELIDSKYDLGLAEAGAIVQNI